MLSLHRRSQLETPLPIASPLPELHKVLNSKLVALQTAKIWSKCVIYTHTHTHTQTEEKPKTENNLIRFAGTAWFNNMSADIHKKKLLNCLLERMREG